MTALKDAQDVYWGTQEVNRVYLGSALAYDGFRPDDLAGLAVWLKAEDYTGIPVTLPQEQIFNTVPDTGGSGAYTLGTYFDPTVDGQVTHYRYWHPAPCGNTHPVFMFEYPGAASIFTVDDVPGSVTGWRTVTLPTPINILGSKTYVVCSYNAGENWGYRSPNPASAAPHMVSTQGIYAAGYAYPTAMGGNAYYADVNFIPKAASWPNPGSGPDAPVVGTPAPATSANTLNGRPVVRFKSAEGRIRLTGTGVDLPFTVAYVGRMVTGTNGRAVTVDYPTRNWALGYQGTMEDRLVESGNLYGGVAATTSWKLYSGDGASGLSRMFSNGTLLQSPALAGGLGGTLYISGYDAAGVQELSDCEIAEVVVYGSKLSDANHQKVESYLRWKWGL